MNIDTTAFISFAVITTYTPGPNNISCAAMGVNFGYRKTLAFLIGITLGFFLLMCLIGLLSGTLTDLVPGLEQILAIIGSLYIVWLAWHTLKAGYGLEKGEGAETVKPLGMHNGLILQLVNPKAIIYAITIYSTFLKNMEISPGNLLTSGAALAALTFTSVSTWTLFGTVISRFMSSSKMRLSVNIILSLLLLWTALKISGLIEWIRIGSLGQ